MLHGSPYRRPAVGFIAVAVVCCAASFAVVEAGTATGGGGSGEGPICVPNPSPRPGFTQIFDPNPRSPGVGVETICTELSEPKVKATVLPQLHTIFSWTNTTREQFYIGYTCEGSVQVSRNISIYLPRGLNDHWATDILGYEGDDAVTLAPGDTCSFFSCYEYTLNWFVRTEDHYDRHTNIYLFGLNSTSCIIDVDECKDGSAGCHHSCVDIRNGSRESYYCTCRDGFILSKDRHSCIDVDECETGENNCDQICTADGGWFNCSCRYGYTLGEDGHTCNDIDECESNGTMLCESETTGRVCTNTPGSHQCHCQDGFEFSQNNTMCMDLDECALNGSELCQQRCDNTVGGYNCSCDEWYKQAGTHNCTARDVCTELDIKCSPHSSCVNYPDSVEGFRCVCDSGYRQNGKSCTLKGIVHVYWVCGVMLLLVCLLLAVGFFCLRQKYLDSKYDLHKKYNTLFRHYMKKEKIDPSYKPVDFGPIRPISYTFSLMSTLEMYGYPSHPSLHELCDEKQCTISPDGKLQSQNEHYVTPSTDADRARRELSAIVEDNEESSLEGKHSSGLGPAIDDLAVELDNLQLPVSESYLGEEVYRQYPIEMCADSESERDDADPNAQAASDTGKTFVIIDGYVQEPLQNTGGLCCANASTPEKSGHCAKEVQATADSEVEPGNETISEDYQTHDEHSSNPMNSEAAITKAEDGGNEVDSPSPSEFSVDSVFSLPTHPKKGNTLPTKCTGSTQVASECVSSDEGNSSGFSYQSQILSMSSCMTDSSLPTSGCYVPTGVSSPSSGYASESGVNKRGSLASQLSCNTPHMPPIGSDGCWTHSQYVNKGSSNSMAQTGREVSDPPPLSTGERLQSHSHQQLPSHRSNRPPPGPYVNSMVHNGTPDDEGVFSPGPLTASAVTCTGYIPYPVVEKTNIQSTTIFKHDSYMEDNEMLPTSMVPSADTQLHTSCEYSTTEIDDHQLDGIKFSFDTHDYECEATVDTSRKTLLCELLNSNGYVEPSQLHLLLPHNRDVSS